MVITRRNFLKLAVGAGVAAAGFVLFRNFESSNVGGHCSEYDLDCIASNLVSGGPPKDGIPAINSPVFISGQEAEGNGWVADGSLVDGISTPSSSRAYPRSITVWHEIVNDTIDGVPTSLTFCPLTGSGVGYRGKAPGGRSLTFGTSGLLYNSNLVMYDRQTDSRYPQVLGLGISGPNKGVELEQVPATTTTWAKWKRAHPDSLVLSRDTGYSRDYSVYPYGDYDTNGAVYFPVANESSRLSAKTQVTGARLGMDSAAFVKDQFRNTLVANLMLGGRPVVAFYDGSVDFVRVFSRIANGSTHTFNVDGIRIVDEETRSVWNPEGVAMSGALVSTSLSPVNHLQVMWFAWYAFHPSTRVAS